MVTADGRKIVTGKLVRCGNLSVMSEEDKKAFALLADTVIDFRTDSERSEKPDIEVAGICYQNIPAIESLTEGITREKSADQNLFARLGAYPEKARLYMCDMYHVFAESDYSAAQYSKFIRLLMEAKGKAYVWHCTAGKDRAGIASVIVEEILGIPREDIINDYLMTNEYLKEEIAFLTDFVKSQAGKDSVILDEALSYLLGAKRDYIEEYYRTIDAKYGGFEAFVSDGLGLSAEEIKQLEQLYLIE